MKKFYRKISFSPDLKKLLENFFSLSLLQGSIYVLQIITFPYLVRVLGPEKFGLIVFAQVFVQYFNLITDYGFNFTATRSVSVHRENREKVSEIFSSVMLIKLGIFLLTLWVLFIILITFEKFRAEWMLYVFAFGMVLGNVLFPIWFFQGMEKMKYITVLNLIARFIFTASIFILIKNPSHYVYVLLLNSLGFLVAGVLSLWIVIKHFNVKIHFPGKQQLLYHLKEGWYIFLSSIGVNIYKTSDIFILGLFSSEIMVGYYSIAKKLIDVANQFAVIVSQTIYPHISLKIRQSYYLTVSFLRRTEIFILLFATFIGITFLLFPEFFIKIVSGEVFHESVVSLRLLAIVPLIIGLNVPAVQILLAANIDREYSRLIVSGALLMLVSNLILIPQFQFKGAAISVIIVETFITLSVYFVVRRNFNRIKSLSTLDK